MDDLPSDGAASGETARGGKVHDSYFSIEFKIVLSSRNHTRKKVRPFAVYYYR